MEYVQRLWSWAVLLGRKVPLWSVVLLAASAVTVTAALVPPARAWPRSGGSWHLLSSVEIPPLGLVFLGTALLALLVTRRVALRSPEGPVTVGTILDATAGRPLGGIPGEATDGADPGAPSPESSSPALTVAALLRDRLATAGRGHPAYRSDVRSILPSYGAVALSGNPASGVTENTYGQLTRVGLRSWSVATQRLGWRVSATLRRGPDDAAAYGLSFVVEHVATGRHDLSGTVWGGSPEEVARTVVYRIAAWRLQKLSPPSTRRAPQWRPNALSLRDYEDAAHAGGQRRFDEAVHLARRSLQIDPGNQLARRLLGETYEWLGHFENAMHTYASGLVQLLDDQNGWSPTSIPRTTDHRHMGWPQRDDLPPLARRQASRLWNFGDGLAWRYVVVLHFAHQWVDRWLYSLEHLEQDRRARSGRARDCAPRWQRELPDASLVKLRELSSPELETEYAARHEQGKRLRGFLHQRYRPLLEREFPLLQHCWFVELHGRQACFPLARSAPRPAPSAAGRSSPWASTRAVVHAESRRIPLERGQGRVRDGLRPPPDGPADVAEWVGELEWLFGEFLAGWVPGAVAVGEQARLRPGQVPPDMETVAADVCARLGVTLDHGAPDAIVHALTHREDHGQVPGWASRGWDRQLVGGVASWAVHHAIRLADLHGTQPAAPQRLRRQLEPAEWARLLMLARQLDLRSFLHRATLYELDRGSRWRRLRRLGPLRGPLQDLMWLTSRFSYLDRQHRLARHRDVVHPDAPQHGEALYNLDFHLDEDDWAALRLETAAMARSITRWRASFRAFLPGTHEWSVWYYAACAHALVIADPPPFAAAADRPGNSDGISEATRWKRRYDAIAEFAVRGLNHVMLVSSRRSLTLIESGTRDWMLFEDPDLDNLRRHPRFQRWAATTFSLDDLAYGSDEDTMNTQVDELARQEWDNYGVYGCDERWGPWSRRWWTANDTHLAQNLIELTPRIVRRWRHQARTATSAPQELDLDEALRLVQQDVRAWRSLASYRRFAARLDLRRSASRRLTRLAGMAPGGAPFPTYDAVLRRPMPINYRGLDPVLNALITDAERDGAELTAELTDLAFRPDGRAAAAASLAGRFREAAERWQRLSQHVEEHAERTSGRPWRARAADASESPLTVPEQTVDLRERLDAIPDADPGGDR